MRRSNESARRSAADRSLRSPVMIGGGIVCVALALASCETSEEGNGTGSGSPVTAASAAAPMVDPAGPIGASPLPRATVGDTYVFDNPQERWTVVAVDDDRVTWESDQGASRVTQVDPLMPSIESAAPGFGQVTRIIQSQTGALWPLAVGNESSFVVAVGMEQPPYSQSLAWNCRVVGVSRIDVEAGTFNTHKVACARSDGLRLNTYYAPTAGYFVRREVTTADQQQETRSLVSFDNAASAAASPDMANAPRPDTAPAAPVRATPLAPQSEGGASSGATPSAPAAMPAVPSAMPPADTPSASTPAPAPAPVAAPAPTRAAPAATAAASASAPPSGGWSGAGVRLASFRSEAAARSGWAKFQTAYPNLLSGLSPRLQRVDLGAQGTYQRLYAGPFESPQRARGLCGKIEEMGSVCDVKTF